MIPRDPPIFDIRDATAYTFVGEERGQPRGRKPDSLADFELPEPFEYWPTATLVASVRTWFGIGAGMQRKIEILPHLRWDELRDPKTSATHRSRFVTVRLH
ncbi:hypothetical protein [Rhizobium sp. CG5]|uniref:hypothetical protein n=1 Tax=Rhizobium sp. CG5 TaxID=2726076 RepID=UPI0020345334|nr:hypothetical protein [Rhizobium sp. CG5]